MVEVDKSVVDFLRPHAVEYMNNVFFDVVSGVEEGQIIRDVLHDNLSGYLWETDYIPVRNAFRALSASQQSALVDHFVSLMEGTE